MRLTGQERGRAEKASRTNEIEDFMVVAVRGLCDFNATFGDEIKRIAGLAFTKNYFARFLAKHSDFRSDPFNNVGIDSVKQPVVAELFGRARALSCFHSS